MGVDYYYCRVCKETYPDCGNNMVNNCEECSEGICSECLEEHNDFSKLKYWGYGSEPGIYNSDEEVLKEFCPLCNKSSQNVQEASS